MLQLVSGNSRAKRVSLGINVTSWYIYISGPGKGILMYNRI